MRPPIAELGMSGPREADFGRNGGAENHETQPLRGQLAVITGTSRGIGAEIAVSLASAGADIIGSHVDPAKEKKQDNTQLRVTEHGVSFNSALGDVSTEEGRQTILNQAIGDPSRPQSVDILVLNAAGGLESKKPETWAKEINIDAQHALVDMFLPYMAKDGKIIYLTSLWAHRYGDLVQLPAYGPVASTKNQFEQELRGRIPELSERGIDVGIIVGHVISGTSAHTLFTRGAAEEMVKLEAMAEGGKFPEASDMGRAVKDLILQRFNSGDTVYIGGQIAEQNTIPQSLDRQGVHNLLGMYGDEKLLIDTFEKTSTQTGRGTYTVREQDTEGHFTGEFEDIQLFRGVDQIEAGAQALGLTVLTNEADPRALGVFKGIRGPASFESPLRPGMTVEIFTEVSVRHRGGFIGNAELRVGDVIASRIQGIDVGLIPNAKMARSILAQGFAQYDKKPETQ